MNAFTPHFNIKKRRKTENENTLKERFNFSKLKNFNRKRSISSTKINKFNDNAHNNSINMNNHHNVFLDKKRNKKNLIKKNQNNKSFSSRITYDNKRFFNIKDNFMKRNSYQFLNTKMNELFKRYSLKNNKEINRNNLIMSDLNLLEDNIKNIINKMKFEIEKKEKKGEIINTISPQMIKNNFISSSNLKFFLTLKKEDKDKNKNKRGSLLIEEFQTSQLNNSFSKENETKRSRSFNYSEEVKKKIIKNLNIKVKKQVMINMNKNNIFDSDTDNEQHFNGFAILPSSNFIFALDLLLTIANFYAFIFFPLNIAYNKDIRIKESIIKEIIHYLIDLIYICDFIISFFRGYYNYEMNIIRNNKTIVLNYLKEYFLFDLLEGIPIFSIIRIFMEPNNNIYSYNSEKAIKFLSIALFIKPFKIFKIIRKKHNRALEEFYSYLSENYYLEQLTKFLIYFLIFFLFVHLFICLHIFLAFQSYPNWIIHTNIINDSFFEKYITSLYFMITTMTTVGYGDIVCIFYIERIYHIILLVIGTLLYTFLVSKIGNYLRDESHEQIKLNKDLNILENIRISCPTMSFKLYNKIKNHLLSIFKKRKKTGISILINGVPDAIKNDLLFKIYSNVINEFTIFKNVNNSSFILQILTNFIPITSKKEEIIILEGEFIENVVFVKDGRLSMEIAIDLNNPIISIQNYLDNNFIGISRQEELRKHSLSNISNILIKQKNSYNNLKARIDNIFLDNQKFINHSNNNRISVDLGRMDFERKEIKKRNNNNNYQIIKIIDIRKNEHFGDVHIVLEQPSPFTLKTKSRIANLLLLPKLVAIDISKNFPNIWKRLEKKSYHNLVSIKQLTFKTLKKFYNVNINHKNNRELYINFNLDITKSSDISFSDKKLYLFNNNIKAINKNMNTSSLIEKIKNNKKDNNYKKSELINDYNNNKTKISVDTFDNELNLDCGSTNTYISNYQNSIFEFPNNFIINRNKTDYKLIKNKNKTSKIQNQIAKTKTLDNSFFFKFHNRLSPKNKLFIKRTKSNSPKYKKPNEKYSYQHINQDTKEENNLNNFNKDNNVITNDSIIQKTDNILKDIKTLILENINQNFSEKEQKKIEKRTIIKKLKELLNLMGIKINKNIFELYLKQNSINKTNRNENAKINSLEDSIPSITNKILSKLFESTYLEDKNVSFTRNNKCFNKLSLKKIKTESFEIKSSYKNINVLTNGEIIKNKKYKIYFENLFKKNINNNFSNNESNNTLFSLVSFNIKDNIKEINLINNKKEKEKKKDDSYFSEIINTSISKNKFKNLIPYEVNKLSSKKFSIEQNNQNFGCINHEDKIISQKNNTSSKFFEKELIKNNKLKTIDVNNQQKEDIDNTNDNLIPLKIKINNNIGEKLYIPQKSNNSNQHFISNVNNIFYKELSENKKNNDKNVKSENYLLYPNNNNPYTKITKINNAGEEKTKICIIY